MMGEGLDAFEPASENRLIVRARASSLLALSASPIAGESGTICSASLFFVRAAGMIQWGAGAVEIVKFGA
jgi:hypothetical protein